MESAERTLAKLIGAVRAAGGPRYRAAQIDPEGGRDGGVPGGNIRSVLLMREGSFTLFPQANQAANKVQKRAVDAHFKCVREQFRPGANPAVLGRRVSAFEDSRKPLVVLLRNESRRVLLVGLHLVSKRGDDPVAGPTQPPRQPSAAQRRRQVQLVADYLSRVRACEPDLGIIVAGDMNDGPAAPSLVPLRGLGLVDLSRDLPEADRYSYKIGRAHV